MKAIMQGSGSLSYKAAIVAAAVAACAAVRIDAGQYEWIREYQGHIAANSGAGGTWSSDPSMLHGWAEIGNTTFTPIPSSTENVVKVMSRMMFYGPGAFPSDAGHASITIKENNGTPGFVVLTSNSSGTATEMTVSADGITPDYDVEYEVEFTVDYSRQKYGVTVNGVPLKRNGTKEFNFAKSATCLSGVKYTGKCAFNSLYGEQGELAHSWTGGGNGSWTASANWNGGVPGEADAAYFLESAISGTKTVSLDSSVQEVGSVSIDAGTGSSPLRFTASSGGGLSTTGTVYMANQAHSSVVVEKTGGSWTSGSVSIANGTGASGVFRHCGGSLGVRGYFNIGGDSGSCAELLVANSAVTNLTHYMSIGGSGDGVVTVKDGGSYFSPSVMYIAIKNSAKGTLNIQDGGAVSVSGDTALCYNNNAGAAAVNVTTGGVFSVKRFTYSASGGAALSPATITLDGGMLRALQNNVTMIPAHANLSVKIGPGNGTIDLNGKNVTIDSSISGGGTLFVTNSAAAYGSVSLAGKSYGGITVVGKTELSVPGDTTVGYFQVGGDATLRLPDTTQAGIRSTSTFRFEGRPGRLLSGDGDMKFVIGSISPAVTSIVAKACYITGKKVHVSFAESPAPGTYTIVSVTGSVLFSSDVLKYLVIDDAVQSGRCRFRISDDERSILLVVGANAYEWIGPDGGDLCVGANWRCGEVPNGHDVVIGVGQDATLFASGDFSPHGITFASTSAVVTVEGPGAVTGLSFIRNEAEDKHHVFSNAVSFAAGEAAEMPLHSRKYVDFSGGMTAYTIAKDASLEETAVVRGKIALTAENEDWSSPGSKNMIMSADRSGTVLTLPSCALSSGNNFNIRTGTSLHVDGNVSLSGGANDARFVAYKNYGTVEISGVVTLSGEAKAYPNSNQSGGTFAVGGLENDSTGRFYLNTPNTSFTAKWAVGASGIKEAASSGGYYVLAASPATLMPLTEYAIDADIGSDAAEGAMLRISTMGWTNKTCHTVAVNGVLSGGMAVELSNAGKVAFGKSATFTGGLSAKSGVAVSVAKGVRLGTGDVVFEKGTSLVLSGYATSADALQVGGAFSVAGGGGKVSVRLGEGTLAEGEYVVLSAASISADGDDFVLDSESQAGRFRVERSGGVATLKVAVGGAYEWTGQGASGTEGLWTTGANWLGGAVPTGGVEPLFTEAVVAGARNVAFDGVKSIGAALRIDAGTAAKPLVFAVKSGSQDGGLSSGGKNVYFGGRGNAVMRFGSGTWSFGQMYVADGEGASAFVTNSGGRVSLTRMFVGSGKNSTAEYCNLGGETSVGGWICVGGTANREGDSNKATLVVDGGAVRGTGNIGIGDYGLSGTLSRAVVKGGGTLACSGYIAVAQGSTGVLDVEDGLVSAADSVALCNEGTRATEDETGTINLGAGGVLETKLVRYGGGKGSAAFNFAGGTLRALAGGTMIPEHPNLTVSVASGNKGFLDANGKSVTIASPVSGGGTLFVTNSAAAVGSVSLAGKSYGGITVVGKTELSVPGDTTVGYFQVGGDATLRLPDTTQAGIRSTSTFRFEGRPDRLLSGDGDMKFVIGSISPAVTSIVAKTCYITGKNVHVSFAESPAPGTYTIVSVTGSVLFSSDVLKYLVIDDAVQSGRCRFRISDDGRSILLKVVPWPEAWNGGHAETAAMQSAFERWVEEYGVTKFDVAAERAFLLGVRPGADTTLAVAAIEKDGDTVTLTSSRTLKDVANGVVFVRCGTSPDKLTGVRSVELGADGRVAIPLSGEPPAEFYQLCIDYKAR